MLNRCFRWAGCVWLLCAVQLLAACGSLAPDRWEVVGAAGFSAGKADCTSLAFGPDGKPYVAYVDAAKGDKASVMRLNSAGTAWETVGGAGFSEGVASDISLAFGPGGKPYISYQDSAHRGKASVMRLNSAGAAWEAVGGAGFSESEMIHTSLAFGPDGKPFVAYGGGTKGQKAGVMRLNSAGAAWEAVSAAGFPADVAAYTSLAFNHEGQPHVAYVDVADGYRARVIRLNSAGMAWETLGGAGISAGHALYTSLAFGPEGKPYVAYWDEANGGKASVMRWTDPGLGD